MAKMKTFAVDVEITVKRTVFIDARRPNGAVERLSTQEGWLDAIRYQDDPVLDSLSHVKVDGVTVTRVRGI